MPTCSCPIADSPQSSLTLCQSFKHPKPSLTVQHHSQPTLCKEVESSPSLSSTEHTKMWSTYIFMCVLLYCNVLWLTYSLVTYLDDNAMIVCTHVQ